MDHDDKRSFNKMHDEKTTWQELKNNSKSSLPEYTYVGGEWIWIDGEWKKAVAGGFRSHALLEHEAAKLGLYPPRERIKVEGIVYWEVRPQDKDGRVIPVGNLPWDKLIGKRGTVTFTEE